MLAPRTLARPDRVKVLAFGAPLPETTEVECRRRGMSIERPPDAPSLVDLRLARGAIFLFDGDAAAGELLRSIGAQLIDHGLLICVGTDDDALQGLASGLLAGLPPEQIERQVAPEAHRFPELLARHDPGPAADPNFRPDYMDNVEDLTSEDLLLMSRAFAGCGKVRLEEMTEGLSGARVFSVHTTRGNSFGSWTQPLFAKLDRRAKVAQEAQGYHAAAPFIPFGLCPKIEQQLLGARRGILVGSFVDQSESLWDVARRGMAGPAIFNLFDTTLGAWRAQGLRLPPAIGPMWPALEQAGVIDVARIRPEYFEEACARGEAMTPATIAARLAGLAQSYRQGPIHGDLHADNVRVRGADAILIDMASTGSGPLSTDVALLETWIAVALRRPEHSEEYRDSDWERLVDILYAPDAFVELPLPSEGGARHRWIWDAVRQIRQIGLANQSCPSEYKTAVVGALMRRCMFASTCRRDRFRRVTAYRLASRLAEALTLNAEVRHVA